MQMFRISPELVEPMTPFLRALNWGTLPLLVYFALRRYLQAVNVVHPIMFALVSANIVNAVGDWVLVYGHLGFRAMGITGSRWSTCIARIYMALVLVITFCWVESKRKLAAWEKSVRLILEGCSTYCVSACRPQHRSFLKSAPSQLRPLCAPASARSRFPDMKSRSIVPRSPLWCRWA